MSIAVCLATRGRLELLGKTVSRILETSVLPDTKIVIGFDRDEADDVNVDSNQPIGNRVIVSVEDREDSLGEKYNRLASKVVADIYVIATDDCAIDTPGWDRMLTEAMPKAFPDGIGVLYFGSMKAAGFESGLPAMQALSAKFIEKVGYFCVSDFPTWFHDTWTDEIATMIGRVVTVPNIAVRYPDRVEAKKSRGIRDVLFWARYFERMRPAREQIARRIIGDLDATEKRKRALLAVIPELAECFTARNSPILDETNAPRVEAAMSFDAPDDERYRRIRSRAERVLEDHSSQPSLRVVA